MVWAQAPPSPGLVPQWAGLYDSQMSRPRDDWILRGSPRAAILVLRRGRLGSPRSGYRQVWWDLLRTQFLVCPHRERDLLPLHNGTQSHGQRSLQAAVRACVHAQPPLQSCPFVITWTLCDHLPGSLSMGFSWREYWSGLPFPSPGHSDDNKDNTFGLSTPPPHPHSV